MRFMRRVAFGIVALTPMASAPTMTLSISTPCPTVTLNGVGLRALIEPGPHEVINGVTFAAQRNGYVVTAPAADVHVGAGGRDNQAVMNPLLPGQWYFKASAHVAPIGAPRLEKPVEVSAETSQSQLCQVKPTTINVAITTYPASGQAHVGNPVKVTVAVSFNSLLAKFVKNYAVEIRSLAGTLVAQQTNQTSENQFSWNPTLTTGATYKISALVTVYAPGPQGEELMGNGSATVNFTLAP